MQPMNLKKTLWAISATFIVCAAGALMLVMAVSSYYKVEMSAHGWGAMIAGTVLSLILGIGLTTLLVWSRRDGFDERADLKWESPDEPPRQSK